MSSAYKSIHASAPLSGQNPCYTSNLQTMVSHFECSLLRTVEPLGGRGVAGIEGQQRQNFGEPKRLWPAFCFLISHKSPSNGLRHLCTMPFLPGWTKTPMKVSVKITLFSLRRNLFFFLSAVPDLAITLIIQNTFMEP